MTLFDAISTGNGEQVIQILKSDSSAASRTNSEGVTPLFLAAHLGNTEIVQVLLTTPVPYNVAEFDKLRTIDPPATPLAILHSLVKGLFATLDANQPNQDGLTPLYAATAGGPTPTLSNYCLRTKLSLIKPSEMGVHHCIWLATAARVTS